MWQYSFFEIYECLSNGSRNVKEKEYSKHRNTWAQKLQVVTFVNVFANDFLFFRESTKKYWPILYDGKRVSAER